MVDASAASSHIFNDEPILLGVHGFVTLAVAVDPIHTEFADKLMVGVGFTVAATGVLVGVVQPLMVAST
jgi:hypothetical protein